MIKVGPTFPDFVSKATIGRRKNRQRGESVSGRSIFPHVILMMVFLFIFTRLFYLQVVRGGYYKELAEGNRIKTKTVRAERGIIFDRNKKSLVRNVPAFRFTENNKVTFLSQENALSLIAKGQEQHLETDIQREYPYKDIFSHVVGYIGEISDQELLNPSFSKYKAGEYIGKTGIEQEYESKLKGLDGKELYEVDSKGKVIRFLGKQEPLAGGDLVTTLDSNLQSAVYQAMSGVKKGAVVVSDPQGEILAMVSKPSFDPDLFTHSNGYHSDSGYSRVEDILNDRENQPLLNRAISGMYPPGSTFKLITAVSALESGAITPDTKIEDTGVLIVNNFTFGNWYFLSYGKKEGMLDVVGALKRSNDIFFYKAAETAGVDQIKKTAKQFFLGERLGIDIMGEEKGVIPDPLWKKEQIGEKWFLGDTYHLGIGQGYLLVTPLQVNMWTSVFANLGTLYKPHLIKNEKSILRQDFIKQEYVERVREGMRQSCDGGGVAWPLFGFVVKNERLSTDGHDIVEDTATDGARLAKIPLACKTGTAETTKTQNPHAWITVFAPFYKPEIVVTVLVENGGEGSSVAAPIAKEILTHYFENKK